MCCPDPRHQDGTEHARTLPGRENKGDSGGRGEQGNQNAVCRPGKGRGEQGGGSARTSKQPLEGVTGCWGVLELKAPSRHPVSPREGPAFMTTLWSVTGWQQPVQAPLRANTGRNFNLWQLDPWFLSLSLECL